MGAKSVLTGLLLGGLLSLGALGQSTERELPACAALVGEEGLHWECSGEELLGSLVQTLKCSGPLRLDTPLSRG